MSEQGKRVFNKEFKTNILRFILNTSKKVSELSRELGINANTLHAWRNQYEQYQKALFPDIGHQTLVEEELRKFRHENRILHEERDILYSFRIGLQEFKNEIL
jgi:transposase-like protein